MKPRELTLRALVLGALITTGFTAANIYLGLKVGLTFALSIPAAVISMAVLSAFKDSSILENNIVQTVASAASGSEPMWRRDGTELVFRNPRGGMLATPVTIGRHFEHGTPRLLFSVPGLTQQLYYRNYDGDPDGKRFLMVTSGGVDATRLNVIFNWPVELDRLKEAPR